MNTDYAWEKWGKKDPYFGVITDEKYRSINITEKTKSDFFESGAIHIEHVLSVCKKHFDFNFLPKRALDFGCGVGRVLIPLSTIADEVVGLDVSDSMLQEADKNCKEQRIENVKLLKSDDTMSRLEGEFNFIHSCIVLQHIPVARGKLILMRLIKHMSKGGIAAIHITYSKSRYNENFGFPKVPLFRSILQKHYRIIKHYWEKASRSENIPMQMNAYDINEILFLIQSANVPYVVSEFTNHGGELGVFLYFQKPLYDHISRSA
jgi:2-polyprenyl-3-methyl-5-hydroxy-6-metoxy-1,4-benzoquinol methylase